MNARALAFLGLFVMAVSFLALIMGSLTGNSNSIGSGMIGMGLGFFIIIVAVVGADR